MCEQEKQGYREAQGSDDPEQRLLLVRKVLYRYEHVP